MSRHIISFPITSTPIKTALDDRRAAVLGRRIKAPPSVVALLAELAWPTRDGVADAIRTAPSSAGVR